MKIRALTLGEEIIIHEKNLPKIRAHLLLIHELKTKFQAKDIDVEYIRFASPPFTKDTKIDENPVFSNLEYVANLFDNLVKEGLLGIYSLSPGLCAQNSELTNSQKNLLDTLGKVMKTHPNMFSSIQVANSQDGVHFEALNYAIKIMKELAVPDPFKNVQFAITSNVPANTPFFPSAYYKGTAPSLSIALEAADELNHILTQFPSTQFSLKIIQQKIIQRFEEIYDEISAIANEFCKSHGFAFEGIDFSPAPYPTHDKSIGTALENVGLTQFGGVGSVFSVGFLTQAIQAINRPKIGFSGFMQPLLEDFTIAQRNNEGLVDLSKLLLYSTMCGLGLDCVPIPGDSSDEAIMLLLMDLFMISIRLKKPLTARLMPIPNRKAGEETKFEFEYFTNSHIASLDYSKSFDLEKFSRNNISYKFD